MSEDGGPKRQIGGRSLLERLRPPAGFVTDSALGTTYSLDLVTAAATLISLNGAARDTADLTLTGTLRALHQLEDRVRFVAQQGCIYPLSGTAPGVLPLLDRLVHTVPFDLSRSAFHPKVWIVRQREVGTGGSDVRYVLLIGSRNLTGDVSWDLGVALEGVVCPDQATNLKGQTLADFVRFACQNAGIESFGDRFHDVGNVVWNLPEGEAEFGFQRNVPTDWAHSALAHLPTDVDSVLLVSPFLDVTTVKQSVKLWGHVKDRRLVAGLADLDKVAHGGGRDALLTLTPRFLEAAREEPSAQGDREAGAAENAEVEVGARGLHAKVIALWKRSRAIVVVGSANLTCRGWRGGNCEAWLKITGRSEAADALWQWSEDLAAEYRAPVASTEIPELDDEKVLDDAHHHVAAQAYTMHESIAGGVARIETGTAPVQGAPSEVSLRITRLSQPVASSAWPKNERHAQLPGCEPAERTEFLIFTLRHGSGPDAPERAWVQKVELLPPLDSGRDGALLQRVLGPQEFLEYLRGYLDPAAADEPDEPQSPNGRGQGVANASDPGIQGALRLEALLRALARGPDDTLLALRRAIEAYRSFAKADDGLSEFWAVWLAVEKAYEK